MASADKGLEEIPEGELSELLRKPHRHWTGGGTDGEIEADIFLPAGQIESNYDETVDYFDTMNLKPELLRGTNGFA